MKELMMMPVRRPKVKFSSTVKKQQENKEVFTGPYFIQNNNIMRHADEPEGKPNKVGRRAEIVAALKNIDTDRVLLQLSYDYLGESRTIEIPRKMLTRTKIQELLDVGVDVGDHNVRDVLRFLSYQEEAAIVKNIHTRVGFGDLNGSPIFKHWKAIGCDSTYKGNLLIEPNGAFEEWKKIIEREVIGHPPLELALVLGLSSPVAVKISKETALEVLVFHIYGDSTIGKTTMARVFVSPFGYPHTVEGGLIKTWNGTKNAIMAHLRHNHGLPMVFDEGSMLEGDFSTFIYQLAGGQEKGRLNQDSEFQSGGQWSGVILSNGEHSLKGKSKQNIGIQMRLFEIGNLEWTKSAENSDALKMGLLKNYGHAGPIFVQYIMNIGIEQITEKWNEWRVRVLEEMSNKNRFSDRMADKVAIILATSEMAREALGLNLNINSIQQLLLDLVNEKSENLDIGENAYNHFLESLTRHNSKFSSERFNENSFELWGKKILKNGRLDEVHILPKIFKEIMKEGEFEDPQIILNNWRNRGWLDHEKGKFTRKKTLKPGTKVNVYVIKIKDLGNLNSEPNGDSSNLSFSRKKIMFKSSHADPN
jgi:putative DNA primase/helicase